MPSQSTLVWSVYPRLWLCSRSQYRPAWFIASDVCRETKRKGGMICLLGEHQARTDRLYFKIVSWVRVSRGTQWVEEEHNILLPAFRQVANQNSFSQSITFQSSWKVLSFCSGFFVKIWGFIFQGSLTWEVLSVHHRGWNYTIFNWEPYSPGSWKYRTCEKIGHKVCNHSFLVLLNLRSFLLI